LKTLFLHNIKIVKFPSPTQTP